MGFSPPLVHKCHLIFTHAPFLILFSLLLHIFSHFILQFTLIPVLVPFSFNALPPFHSIFSVFPLYGLNIAYGTPCIYLSLHAVAVNFDTFWRWGESGPLADDPVQRGRGLSRPPHQEAGQGGHALLHVATESFNILILLLPLGLPHLRRKFSGLDPLGFVSFRLPDLYTPLWSLLWSDMKDHYLNSLSKLYSKHRCKLSDQKLGSENRYIDNNRISR